MATGQSTTFNVKRITGSFQPSGGSAIQFKGYMGDFIEVDSSEDAVTPHISEDGTHTAVLNANESAMATLSIVQGSETNDLLDKYVPSAGKLSLVRGTFTIRDLNGNTVCTDPQAYIVRRSKITFGGEVKAREWKFFLPKPDITAGGGAA
jgi:hypothetical protein